jgi:hypothetical protein
MSLSRNKWPGKMKRRQTAVLTVTSVLLALAVVPLFELPFGSSLSLLDLAQGSLSGGHWPASRVLVVAVIAVVLVAFVFTLILTLRSAFRASK